MTQYTIVVRFTRELTDDSDVIAATGEKVTPAALTAQFVSELQKGFETAEIAGTFEVVSTQLADSFLDSRQLATVLAALRFYQEGGQSYPANRSDAINDIATHGDNLASLDLEEIDALCVRLNTAPEPPAQPARIANILEACRVADSLDLGAYVDINGMRYELTANGWIDAPREED